MAYACDECLSICPLPELAIVSGWWGSQEISPASARKPAIYRSVQLAGEERLSGHICRSCIEQRLSKDIRINLEKSRSVICEERRAQYPKESPIESLRKTVPVLEDVVCDHCEQSCRKRYMEVRSEWADSERAHQVFHLCDHCYGSSLFPLNRAKKDDEKGIYKVAWDSAEECEREPSEEAEGISAKIKFECQEDNPIQNFVPKPEPIHRKRWRRYSEGITEPPGKGRDLQIACNALNAGLQKKALIDLVLRNSPVARNFYNKEGSTPAYHYVSSVVGAAISESKERQKEKSKGAGY